MPFSDARAPMAPHRRRDPRPVGDPRQRPTAAALNSSAKRSRSRPLQYLPAFFGACQRANQPGRLNAVLHAPYSFDLDSIEQVFAKLKPSRAKPIRAPQIIPGAISARCPIPLLLRNVQTVSPNPVMLRHETIVLQAKICKYNNSFQCAPSPAFRRTCCSIQA